MKRLLLVTALFLALAQGPLQGLLSPLDQSMKEFKALTEDRKLLEKLLPGETIIGVTRFDKAFTVVTTQHKIHVDIVYDKSDKIGPAKFHFVFHDPQPR